MQTPARGQRGGRAAMRDAKGWADSALEYGLFAVWMAMVAFCPWTKVEESFSVQIGYPGLKMDTFEAMHDILVHGRNVSSYDHREFPGVVPRSFAGPLAVAALAYLPSRFIEAQGLPKYLLLQACRLVLGFYVWLALRGVADAVASAGGRGRSQSRWFLLLCMAQFHVSFYATRPLPNTFALAAFLVALAEWLRGELLAAAFTATVSAAIFRSELVLLYAPLFLPALLQRRLSLLRAALVGLAALAASLLLSLPIDSYFWDRWLWPEAEVWWYNVVENKSGAWGRMPLLWYFYSALPRALGLAFPVGLVGLVTLPSQRHVVLSALFFVGLYSLLPHKELRFVIYAVPMINIAAAGVLDQMWTLARRKGLIASSVLRLFALGVLASSAAASCLFLQAARWNYPGGDALLRLHQIAPDNYAYRVHIDVYSAQSGVSRFLHLHDGWLYDKTEELGPTSPQKLAADFVLVGSDKLRSAMTPYERLYHRRETLAAFDGLALPSPLWRLWEVRFRYRDAVAILVPHKAPPLTMQL